MPAYRDSTLNRHETGPAILLRVEEAAQLLRISRTAVFGLLGSGELRSITIGRRRRIPRAAVDEYVAARLSQADAPTAS